MINKTILPLLTTSFIFIGASVSCAMESKKDETDRSKTARSATPSSSPLPMQDDVDSRSSWLKNERAMAKLLPANDMDFSALVSDVDGWWDPEEPINYNGLLQRTIYISKLEAKRARILAKIGKDPQLNGHDPVHLHSSSLPLLPDREVPAPSAKEEVSMPVFNEDQFKKHGLPGAMVQYCYDVTYKNLVNSSLLRMAGVTVESLTSSLVNHSIDHNKGWPVDILKRIAGHIINFDDIDDLEQGEDTKAGDAVKK